MIVPYDHREGLLDDTVSKGKRPGRRLIVIPGRGGAIGGVARILRVVLYSEVFAGVTSTSNSERGCYIYTVTLDYGVIDGVERKRAAVAVVDDAHQSTRVGAHWQRVGSDAMVPKVRQRQVELLVRVLVHRVVVNGNHNRLSLHAGKEGKVSGRPVVVGAIDCVNVAGRVVDRDVTVPRRAARHGHRAIVQLFALLVVRVHELEGARVAVVRDGHLARRNIAKAQRVQRQATVLNVRQRHVELLVRVLIDVVVVDLHRDCLDTFLVLEGQGARCRRVVTALRKRIRVVGVDRCSNRVPELLSAGCCRAIDSGPVNGNFTAGMTRARDSEHGSRVARE